MNIQNYCEAIFNTFIKRLNNYIQLYKLHSTRLGHTVLVHDTVLVLKFQYRYQTGIF